MRLVSLWMLGCAVATLLGGCASEPGASSSTAESPADGAASQTPGGSGGVEIAVNQWLGVNGCSEKTWSMQAGMPTDPDQAACRAYADCGRFPVKLCLTSGKGHIAQDGLSWPGFWQLFQQSLPK